ncbi:MAG: DcrB-related protein [Chitinispirillaceae bacterium]|nr:DcrB-related protein [Chitinispirillaceae bacterium]
MTTNNLFQLTLPSSWKETTVYTFEGPHDSGVQHNLVLVIDSTVPKKIELAEYAKIQFGTNKEVLPGFALISEKEKQLSGGQQAYEIIYKYAPSDDQVLFQKQVFMIIEEKGYIFTATFSKKTLQTIAVEVDRIIADFRPLKVA